MKKFSNNFDLVLTSGGIGPTHDDVTFEGVARWENLLRQGPTILFPGHLTTGWSTTQKLSTCARGGSGRRTSTTPASSLPSSRNKCDFWKWNRQVRRQKEMNENYFRQSSTLGQTKQLVDLHSILSSRWKMFLYSQVIIANTNTNKTTQYALIPMDFFLSRCKTFFYLLIFKK